ncbi:MAG: Ig-like domain-containing protein [Pirellulaceae bacterium]
MPEITLDTPPSEIRTNANLTVTGQVTDSGSAVESLLACGRSKRRSSSRSRHRGTLYLHHVAASGWNGRRPASGSVPSDRYGGEPVAVGKSKLASGVTLSPTATSEATGTLSSQLGSFSIEFSESMNDATFDAAANYMLVATSGSAAGQALPIASVSRVADNIALVTLATPMENAGYRLTLTPPNIADLAGNVVTPTTFNFDVLQPTSRNGVVARRW